MIFEFNNVPDPCTLQISCDIVMCILYTERTHRQIAYIASRILHYFKIKKR